MPVFDAQTKSQAPRKTYIRWRALIFTAIAAYFFFAPAITVLWTLRDPAWRNGGVANFVVARHAALAARLAPWAEARVKEKRADALSTADISGTEWPNFSAVFFLLATDHLQSAHEQKALRTPPPKQQFARAIRAAADLIADPGHATWVKKHWGAQYLDQKNLFYRMLLIAGLDRYEALSGDQQTYGALLRTQLMSLSAELDQSEFGLLEDYPNQVYPVDVMMAYGAIATAQQRLGNYDAAFVTRAQRTFAGARLDPIRKLPAYSVDIETGEATQLARGVGMSMMLIHAIKLWPTQSQIWYQSFVDQYWQSAWGLVGFREFPIMNGRSINWMVEVDAGPIVAGYGTAANAFGLAAARAHGDTQRAHALSALGLLASWPLPGGTLLGPRLVSNFSDAPYIGEAALLYSLSLPSAMPIQPSDGKLPLGFYLGIGLQCLVGGFLIYRALRGLRS